MVFRLGAIPTKRVRYVGDHEVVIMSTGQVVKPGDEIDVDDAFVNALFVPVKPKKSRKETEES